MGTKNGKKKKYMSVKEMGNLLGIKKSDSYYLVKKGYFKIIEAAGKMWVDTSSFEEWYDRQTKYHKVTGEEPGREITVKSFSVKEMAAMLKITESMAYHVIRVDRIPVIWDCGHMRVVRKDFWIWHDCQIKYRVSEDMLPEKAGMDHLISIPVMADLLDISSAEAYRLAEDPAYASCLTITIVKDRMYVSYRDFDRFIRGQNRYCYHPRKDPGAARVSGDLYLNSRQACWYAKVSRPTLVSWCKQEHFTVKRAGNIVRIPLREFDEWLDKRKEEGKKWHR